MGQKGGKREKKISADVALGLISEDESDGYSSSSSRDGGVVTKREGPMGSDEDEDSEEEDDRANQSTTKRSHFDAFEDASDDDEDEDGEDKRLKFDTTDSVEKEAFKDLVQESKITKKLKNTKLTPEQLAKHQKKIAKTGVIYLSKIPPYMKPAKVRQVLSRFGSIDRLFLKPEDIKVYQRRVKYGGNKKRSYVEGWAEFLNKKDAKLCAHTLNGNILGGKKGSFYYDDVMNIKYIKGFKWTDLTEQISRENEIRQAKLQAELSQAKKLNKTYIANVEKSKMISNMQKKRAEKRGPETTNDNDDAIEMRRTFAQRAINSKRADAPDHLKIRVANDKKLDDVLSNIF